MAKAHGRRRPSARYGLTWLDDRRTRMLTDIWYRLQAIFRRDRLDTDLDEELRWHLEHETEKYLRSGIPEDEAKRRARLALGGIPQVSEQCRNSRGISALNCGRTFVTDFGCFGT